MREMLAAVISIHALLAESDKPLTEGSEDMDISIHALLAESDAAGALGVQAVVQFLSTLSLRRATAL